MVQDDWPCISECACQGRKDTKKEEKKGKIVCMHVHLTPFKLLHTLPCLTEVHSARRNQVPRFIDLTKSYPD